MPLDADEFDMIAGSLRESILTFFKRNRFSAYTADEVLFELGTFGVFTTREVLDIQVRELILQRRLLRSDRDGEVYYRYDNRLGLGH
ncbi:MAG: hypothetical protein AB7P33_08850 [Dehalococcoidia bacterium]